MNNHNLSNNNHSYNDLEYVDNNHFYNDLKIQNNQLTEEIKAKDLLFSILSHDLMSPISGIVSLTNYVCHEDTNFKTDDYKECFKDINISSKQVYELLSNMIEWSKMKKNEKNLNFELLDINEIVNSNIDLLKINLKQKEITIEIKIENNIQINADKHSIDSIIRNLLSNAIKFSNAHSKIIISAFEDFEDQNFVTICIQDFGVGMSDEYAESVMNRDSTQSKEGTSKEKGLGIGLRLCKELVNRNRGKIWAESIFGIGSSFYISFKKAII
ncbi:MAG: HAMP domain-containing sensor histidine kinase [Candidatus Kapabacteria bacterium]|nr:HAMP domain-containing sensor histidine kinase [Candidatus Kapabacteria bacterium]